MFIHCIHSLFSLIDSHDLCESCYDDGGGGGGGGEGGGCLARNILARDDCALQPVLELNYIRFKDHNHSVQLQECSPPKVAFCSLVNEGELVSGPQKCPYDS